jgi:predicted transglutaminase-like cysteine proteinase
MLGRVAAGGIAAFLVVMPVASSGETNASNDAPPAAAIALTAPAPTQDKAEDAAKDQAQTQSRAQDQTQGQAQNQPQGQVQAQDRAQDQTQDRTQDQAQDQVQTPDQAQDQPQNQPHVEVQEETADQTQIVLRGRPDDDGAARQQLAALDPAEPPRPAPSIAAPTMPSPAMTQPFGLAVVPVAGGEILQKWSGVEAALRAEDDVFSRCQADAELCPPAARNFLAIVAQGRAQTGRARLGVINRAVNMAIIPTSDLAQWGVIDRWSPPLETFTTGRGDCEDYAIAKYAALRRAGLAAEDVRLVIVRNVAVNEDHAVAAARLDGHWIILDNRFLKMVEDSQMSEVIPLFVLDQTGVWQFAPTAMPQARRAAPASIPSP